MKKIKITESQKRMIVDTLSKTTINESFETLKKLFLSLSSKKNAQSGVLVLKKAESEVNQVSQKIYNDLFYELNNIAPNFPNCKEQTQFLNGVLLISMTYDTIIHATKLEKEDENYIPPQLANMIISDLNTMVERALNKDLASIYNYVDETIANDTRNSLYTKPSDGEETEKEKSLKSRSKEIGAVAAGALLTAAKVSNPILSSIGITSMFAGAIFTTLKNKGLRQSRAKTLADLLRTILPLDDSDKASPLSLDDEPSGNDVTPNDDSDSTNIIPNSNTDNTDNQNVTPSVSHETNDNSEIISNIQNLFSTIYLYKKQFGSPNNVGNGSAFQNQRMKRGDIYSYNGSRVEVINPDLDGRVQVRSQNKAKNVFTVPKDALTRLNEGRYIKDKRIEQFLNKNLSVDKLSIFESLMSRIEYTRNIVRNMKGGNDQVLQKLLNTTQNNPIMLTDFNTILSVDSSDQMAPNRLKSFIEDFFVKLYSGNYKYSSLIDKLGSVSEEIRQDKTFKKDSQDIGRLMNNIIKFLNDLVSIYSYLTKKSK